VTGHITAEFGYLKI